MSSREINAYAAIGLSPSADIDTTVKALQKQIEDSRVMTDPGVLDALVIGEDRKFAEAYPTQAHRAILRPDAKERWVEVAKDEWRAKAKAAVEAADSVLPFARASLEARIANQRVLRGESDQTNSDRTETLLARLLDDVAENRAEQWIDRATPAQVLTRYRAATDDSGERAFCRVVERMHATKLFDFAAEKQPIELARQYREAIEARQNARVRPSDFEALATLDAIRVDLDRAAVAMGSNVGRAFRSVGKEGTLPRPVRLTTPDDGQAVVN